MCKNIKLCKGNVMLERCSNYGMYSELIRSVDTLMRSKVQFFCLAVGQAYKNTC